MKKKSCITWLNKSKTIYENKFGDGLAKKSQTKEQELGAWTWKDRWRQNTQKDTI